MGGKLIFRACYSMFKHVKKFLDSHSRFSKCVILIQKQNDKIFFVKVLSMYLSCSGYTEVSNVCLDRVVCEYADEDSDISEEEKDVISM